MYKWYLPTLSEIIRTSESEVLQSTRTRCPRAQAEQEWYGAIAALDVLLQTVQSPPQEDLCHQPTPPPTPHGEAEVCAEVNASIKGLILSGPFPILNQSPVREQFAHWTLTGDPTLRQSAFQLPAAGHLGIPSHHREETQSSHAESPPTLGLHPDDPLAVEPFCLVLTAEWSLVVTLGLDDQNSPQFFFSFEPDSVWQSWRSLRSRLQLTAPGSLAQIDPIAEQFAPPEPSYRVVMEFSQLLVTQMARLSAQSQARRRSPRCGGQQHPRAAARAVGMDTSNPATSHSAASDTVHPESFEQNQDSALDRPASHPRGRYPRKPLNVNRTDRLKFDPRSWNKVLTSSPESPHAIDQAQGDPRLESTPARQANKQGNRQTSRTVRSVSAEGAEPTNGSNGPQHSARGKGAHDISQNEVPQAVIGSDVELLKAIAHEVRTPLTTIRTLTRLLLKRSELADIVIKRLEQIDRECTKQIDRFSLIFKAVELETASADRPPNHLANISLASMSLASMVQQNVDRWQHQAKQRNLTLDVVLPQSLPPVMSDPTMLDQVLTGLLDRMTHTLPPGTLIELSVVPAGHQLKLQFWAKPQPKPTPPKGADASAHQSERPKRTGTAPHRPMSETNGPSDISVDLGTSDRDGGDRPSIFAPTLRSVGQLLMFQPETGNLSLNMAVTKNIFQSLGGKLIVRHTQQKGEVLTIFLPLDNTESSHLLPNTLSTNIKGKYFC